MNVYRENYAIYLMIINILISPVIMIIIFNNNIKHLFNDPDYINKQISKQGEIELSKILCVVFVSLYSNIVKVYSEYTYDAWYLFYVQNLKQTNMKSNNKIYLYNVINQTNILVSNFIENISHISINILLVIIPKLIKLFVKFVISIYMTYYYLNNKQPTNEEELYLINNLSNNT